MASQPHKIQSVQRSIAEMRTVYPVGRRPHRARLLLSLAALATATLVLLGPSQSPAAPPHSASELNSEASVDSVVARPDTPTPQPAATRQRLEPPPPTVASSAQVMGTVVMHANTVPATSFVELGALDSTPGETLEPFLTRVAQAMDSFTSTTGHEVCGVVMTADAGEAWRVRLTTNRSHIGCVMVSFDEPGFHRFGTDIHSHPRLPGGTVINAQDVVRRSNVACTAGDAKCEREKFVCGNTAFVFDETFSGQDLKRGPGYLVSRNRLLYQRGAQYPFRQIATFETLDKAPVLALGGTQSAQSNVVPADVAASAAWANEDVEGIPHTHCEPSAKPADALASAQPSGARRAAP